MTDQTNRTGLPVAGGVPIARDDGAPEAETDEGPFDATLAMSAEEWLEHALGDLHSSAWTTPAVEL